MRIGCFLLVLFLITTLVLSCNGDTFGGGSGTKKSEPSNGETESSSGYRVEPQSLTVNEGETALFKAYDTKTGKDVSSKVSWSVDNENVAVHKKNGSFLTKKAGTVTVKASSEQLSGTANLSVERPEELVDGVKYSRLVFGIENCIDGPENDVGECLGDCDDAFVIIEGDLSLGTYGGELYIQSNSSTPVKLTTYNGTWDYPAGSSQNPSGSIDRINQSKSLLTVTVKDRTGKSISSKKIQMRKLNTCGGVLDCGGYRLTEQVDSTTVSVERGYAIDIKTHFEGTALGGCRQLDSALTRNKNMKAGYLLREKDCNYHSYTCCNQEAKNAGHCSTKQ